MTLPYYANREMAAWVKSTVKKYDIQLSVAFSSSMAQYFQKHESGKIVVDFVDVDSDKWRQYSKSKVYPLNYLYRREADQLLKFEKNIVSISDKSFLVSSAEAALFKRLVGDYSNKIGFYNNGVDASYFNPHQWYQDPYRESSPVLVFTGAMDYWPNVDAVAWFSREVFPELQKLRSNLKFYIVGRNPTRSVLRLNKLEGITVTGRVDDIRPYLKYATAVVAPLRIARGVQNKILEAMAMEKIVLASDAGLEGIDAELGMEVLLTNTVEDYCEFLPKILQHNCSFIGEAARQRVVHDFNWEHTLPKVGASLEGNVRRELEHD
ncbi:TIGR03087 family PEP-CTERM/XrtA system glycosyltransferase [Pseudomaricurvus hydrocarbonicus]